jgi:hypothetical protein
MLSRVAAAVASGIVHLRTTVLVLFFQQGPPASFFIGYRRGYKRVTRRNKKYCAFDAKYGMRDATLMMQL